MTSQLPRMSTAVGDERVSDLGLKLLIEDHEHDGHRVTVRALRELQQARQRLAAAERDAERYRWLRSESAKGVDGLAHVEIQDPEDDCAVFSGHEPDHLDTAIDDWMPAPPLPAREKESSNAT